MNHLLALLPVVLPMFFWAAYHLHADRYLPEPPGHLLLAFALGVAGFYLGRGMYVGLGVLGLRYDATLLAEQNLWGLFAYALLAIGVIEELAKMLPFLLVVLRFREFNEPIDGIIYASFIALGFAAVENNYYLQFLGPGEAYARAFAGSVVHIVFASVWGYYLGRRHLRRRTMLPAIAACLVVTAGIHGLYDFIVLGLSPGWSPAAALIIAGLWIWRLFLIRDLHTSAAELRARQG